MLLQFFSLTHLLLPLAITKEKKKFFLPHFVAAAYSLVHFNKNVNWEYDMTTNIKKREKKKKLNFFI